LDLSCAGTSQKAGKPKDKKEKVGGGGKTFTKERSKGEGGGGMTYSRVREISNAMKLYGKAGVRGMSDY